jgi:hypothetical protein
MRWLLWICVVMAGAARARIAPECTDIVKPSNYSEDGQQSFLQNYFAAGFLLTPLGEALPRPGEAQVFLELGLIPGLPQLGPVQTFAGVALVPPVPSPVGTLLVLGAEFGVGTRVDSIAVALRAHLSFARMRAEIASPFSADDPVVEDLFFTNNVGVDLNVGYDIDITPAFRLVPSIGVGVADVSTLFLIGDDNVIVQNVDTPWAGAVASAGVQATIVDWILVSLEASYAVPIYPTIKAGIGLSF